MSSTPHINVATTSLKNTPLVVREENNVSRQVVKPIYLEGIELNNSLMSNLIVVNPYGTMQARYMVTDIEDYSYMASSSTSLNPIIHISH